MNFVFFRLFLLCGVASFVHAQTTPVRILLKGSNLFLQATTNNVLELSPWQASDRQLFHIIENRDGSCVVVSAATSLAMSLAGQTQGDGTPVSLNQNNGTDDTRWIIQQDGGDLRFTAQVSGLALSRSNPPTRVGSTLQLWKDHKGDNQRWRLVAAATSPEKATPFQTDPDVPVRLISRVSGRALQTDQDGAMLQPSSNDQSQLFFLEPSGSRYQLLTYDKKVVVPNPDMADDVSVLSLDAARDTAGWTVDSNLLGEVDLKADGGQLLMSDASNQLHLTLNFPRVAAPFARHWNIQPSANTVLPDEESSYEIRSALGANIEMDSRSVPNLVLGKANAPIFSFVAIGNGLFTIRLLDGSFVSVSPDGNIHAKPAAEGKAMQWRIVAARDQKVQFVAADGEKVLQTDDMNGSVGSTMSTGANVHSDSQLWTLASSAPTVTDPRSLTSRNLVTTQQQQRVGTTGEPVGASPVTAEARSSTSTTPVTIMPTVALSCQVANGVVSLLSQIGSLEATPMVCLQGAWRRAIISNPLVVTQIIAAVPSLPTVIRSLR